MSTGSINNVSNGYLQSLLSRALQNTETSTQTGDSLSAIDTSFAQQPDNGGLSPFAQLMSTLQQLQQSDPSKYQQVTAQIAANLQTAAQNAQSDGNTTVAARLTQLSNDFTEASKSGQLPNIQDLAQAVGGHHRPHGHHHSHTGGSDSNSATDQSQNQDPILAAFQTNNGQNETFNATSIILDTLSNAGVQT